jgi:beta-aspartyl-peptidase (threonine type)
MTRLFHAIAAFALMIAPYHWATAQSQTVEEPQKSWSLVLHGGAGTISRDRITKEKDAEIRAVLTKALDAGAAVLEKGGTATDAIIATIMILEDNPNFNAGKGAVFTWEGTNSLDSSIMDGATRNAGAAAGSSTTKNPILLARAVMDNSRHVMLSGAGADQFSREQGLEQVENSYFATPDRREALERFKLRQNAISAVESDQLAGDALGRDWRFGTVGAVAVDNEGNIAAGTSTGGLTGKQWGRIGDSPIIGAGTYADNRSCGISATGAGEYFIRVGVAQEICTRLRIAHQTKGAPLSDSQTQDIADSVMAEMAALGGDGGIIYATPWGQTGYSFDTPGMYRGKASSEGDKSVAIYGDEE